MIGRDDKKKPRGVCDASGSDAGEAETEELSISRS